MAPFQKRPRTAIGRRQRSSRAPRISTAPGKPVLGAGQLSFQSTRTFAADMKVGEERRCLLRVSCEPGSDILNELETFTSAYLKQRFRPSLAQSVATASYELCSNAISYASVATDVTFELWASPSSIEVQVENEAVAARVEVLKQVSTRVLADPENAYLDELRRSMAGKMPRAMLGLARVAHEAAMQLEVQVFDRRVRVTARCAR